MIRCSFILPLILFSLVGWTQLEEKEIFVIDQNDTLWGTLCSPQKKIDTSQTLVLIIAGSGPTDRNGNNAAMKNNSLQMLAHDLSKFGIASIRYDKRGVGASIRAFKKEENLTFGDNVIIANHFYDRATQLGYQKIVIAGHSEGSLIGILLSQQVSPLGFVSLAGAGSPIQDILKQQYNATAPIVRDSACVIIDLLAAGQRIDTLSPWLYSVFRPSVQPYMISWMSYDPAIEITKLSCPSLILQGDQDLQVSVEDAEKLEKAIDQEKAIILQDMNHVLKKTGPDKTANKAAYNNPSLPLHPDLVFNIVAFIKELQ